MGFVLSQYGAYIFRVLIGLLSLVQHKKCWLVTRLRRKTDTISR
jgi:hypothetical protein